MIYLYSPDDARPNGGIRKIYNHADVLNRHGYKAVVVHLEPGFRCTWFQHDTPVINATTVRPTPDDFMLVPEIFGPNIAQVAPGIRKVIFNQNCYNSFQQYPLDGRGDETPYLHPDCVAAITVSEDGFHYLRYAFPKANILRMHPGVDSALFHPGAAKRKQIAFMPRRSHEEARQVFNILKFRGALKGFDVVEINAVPHEEAARILRESAIFFSFSGIEGFGLPPAEAMASACVTIGFHGRGGREFFRPEFSWPIEFGDIENYARTAETVLERYRNDPSALKAQGQQAAKYIAEHYSPEIEEADILACWRQIAGEPGP